MPLLKQSVGGWACTAYQSNINLSKVAREECLREILRQGRVKTAQVSTKSVRESTKFLKKYSREFPGWSEYFDFLQGKEIFVNLCWQNKRGMFNVFVLHRKLTSDFFYSQISIFKVPGVIRPLVFLHRLIFAQQHYICKCSFSSCLVLKFQSRYS